MHALKANEGVRRTLAGELRAAHKHKSMPQRAQMACSTGAAHQATSGRVSRARRGDRSGLAGAWARGGSHGAIVWRLGGSSAPGLPCARIKCNSCARAIRPKHSWREKMLL